MRRRRTTVIGIVCGAICALCVLLYTGGVRSEAESARAEVLAQYGGDQVEVCVAKRDIAAGETIEPSALEVRRWVADLLPPDAVRSASDAVGKRASATVLAGEALSARRIGDARMGLDVPEGLTAVSVPAKDVQAVGGAVSPGSRVDMYATGGSSTDEIARNVLVLATSAGDQEGSSGQAFSWITVAVEPQSAREVVSAAQKTELYFTLPGSGGKDGAK